MFLMTRAAIGERADVRPAMKWRQRVGPHMASGVRAGLERSCRRRLRVRIVAIPAAPLVWIVRGHESLDHLSHFVTPEAIALRRNERRKGDMGAAVGNRRR